MSPAEVRKVVPFRLSAEEAEIIAAAVELVERSPEGHYYGPRCTLSSFVRHAAIRLAEQVTGTLALGYQGTLLGDRITAAIARSPAQLLPEGPPRFRGKRDAAARTLPMFPEDKRHARNEGDMTRELARRARRAVVAPVAKAPDVTGWGAAAARARARAATPEGAAARAALRAPGVRKVPR